MLGIRGISETCIRSRFRVGANQKRFSVLTVLYFRQTVEKIISHHFFQIGKN